jgi:LuxR family transcriptional regulator, maltose regulon positive regulatory protein
LLTVFASLLAALTARPVEAERWADVVDRRPEADAARPADPVAEAWAGVLRALLCRHGVEQMRADADEATRRFAAIGVTEPAPILFQGIARVLSGDLDGGDAAFQDAASAAKETDSADVAANALCQQSLLAIARGEWDQAAVFIGQARMALHEARLEESYLTPLVCAVQARVALRRGDVPAARGELVSAQRLRPQLTYALPYLAVQARIELARVHLALSDIEGARTLIREIDEVLRRRPGLGTLAGEALALQGQVVGERGSKTPGASVLTAAELRLLPMLSTHLSFPEIAAEMFLSRHTIKSEAFSIYRKLGVTSRSQAVTRSRDLGLLEGWPSVLHTVGVVEPGPARGAMDSCSTADGGIWARQPDSRRPSAG